MIRWWTSASRASASSTAATLSGLLPERPNETSRVGVRREIEFGRADDVGRRHRLDAAAGDPRESRGEAAADERRGAGAGKHDPQVWLGEQRREEASMSARLDSSSAWVARSVSGCCRISRRVQGSPASADWERRKAGQTSGLQAP